MQTSNRHAAAALDAAVKCWPSEGARREAERIVNVLCSRSDIDAVVVFGSSIRRAVRSFDLDLLYVYSHEKPESLSARMEVDLRGYSRSQVEQLIAKGHDLLCWSLKFGEIVCERNDYWSQLRVRLLPTLKLPSLSEAKKRTEKAWTLFADLLQLKDFEAALEQYVTYLTHEARAAIIASRIYPGSRPELPDQLRGVGQLALAAQLEQALRRRLLLSEGQDQRVQQFLLAAYRAGTRFKTA